VGNVQTKKEAGSLYLKPLAKVPDENYLRM